MHIAFLNPQGNFDPQDRYWTEHPDFGGQLVYVKELALELGQLGHRVDILTRRIEDPNWPGFEGTLDSYPEAPNVRIIRLECGGLGFRRKEDLWPYLGTEWVPNLIDFYRHEKGSPEVASAHYGDGGLAAALWQRSGGPPFTFTAHSLGAQKVDRLLAQDDQSLRALDDHFLFRRRSAAERVAMNHAAFIVTSTHQERQEQYSHRAYSGAVDPQDEARFKVIPPGVNLDVFDAEIEGEIDRRVERYLFEMFARDLAPERRQLPGIISSSRLDRKKNLLGLVRAYAASPEVQERANLLLVLRGQEDLHSREGLGEEERAILDQIVDLIDTNDLWERVSGFSLSSQAELAATYRVLRQNRSIFALTALYEPFGLAPLEAMAAGLPVVVTRNGGPSESMREGQREYGVLVDPSDPKDIADGLLRLLESRETWQAFQRRGRRRVLDRYTWNRTALGYFELLETIPDMPEPGQRSVPIPDYFERPSDHTDLQFSDLEAIWSQAQQSTT